MTVSSLAFELRTPETSSAAAVVGGMRPREIVHALANAWRALYPHHQQYPEQRERLARQTAECLAYLTGQRDRGDPTMTDLALAHTVQLCERLSRAIQTGTALTEDPPPITTPEFERNTTSPQDSPLSVSFQPGLGVVIEVTGYVTSSALQNTLVQLGPLLETGHGALLVDARTSRGHDLACGKVLAEWVATGHARRLRRVGVVVNRGMQFVRAIRALAAATGVAWMISHERERVERWLALRTEPTN